MAAVGERGAGFKSLKDAWADTTTAHGRLMLTVLGGLAEFERELIMARTGEGRKAGARARCQIWPPAEADATSEAGSPCSATGWRDPSRYRPELRCRRHNDREAAGVKTNNSGQLLVMT